MSKFERHLAKPIKMELVNEEGEKDVYMIKPLPFKYMPDFYDAMKVISKFETSIKDNISEEEQSKQAMELINKLDKSDFEKLRNLVQVGLKHSYPDESDDELDAFAAKNFFIILTKIMEANTHESKVQDRETKKFGNK